MTKHVKKTVLYVNGHHFQDSFKFPQSHFPIHLKQERKNPSFSGNGRQSRRTTESSHIRDEVRGEENPSIHSAKERCYSEEYLYPEQATFNPFFFSGIQFQEWERINKGRNIVGWTASRL